MLNSQGKEEGGDSWVHRAQKDFQLSEGDWEYICDKKYEYPTALLFSFRSGPSIIFNQNVGCN